MHASQNIPSPLIPIAPAQPTPPTRYITGFEGGDAGLRDLIGLARHIKAHPDLYARRRPLAGKILTALYLNPSLRTRTSFESGMLRLGGHVINLSPGAGSWPVEFDVDAIMNTNKAEHIIEAAGVLSSYSDAVGLRAFAGMQDFASDMMDIPINTLANYASVPIISLESAAFHPAQALADALTLHELFDGHPHGKHFTLCWASHPKMCGTAVPHSALLTAARLGMNVTLAHPTGYDLHAPIVSWANTLANETGGSLTVTHDIQSAATADTQIIYAKSWGSPLDYGTPSQGAARNAQHQEWCVDASMMAKTQDAHFMHCLPVRRGVVVTADVLDSPKSVVQQQAANRMWAQMALMLRMMG